MAELTDLQRKRLDAIVGQMTDNGEKPEDIQFVVNDFKAKYAKPAVGAGYQRFNLPYMQSPEGGEVAKRFGVTPGQLSEAAQEVKTKVLPAVLPTAGQILGGMGGGLITAPSVGGVPAGVLAGEAAGGAFGEQMNQWLGITEPSLTQTALAGATPGIARTLGGAIRGTARVLAPKLSGAGAALRDWASGQAERIPALAAPSTPSDRLYAVVDRYNPSIDLTPVKVKVAELAEQQAPRAEFGVDVPGGVGKVIRRTSRALEPPEPRTSVLIDPNTNRPFVHEIEAAARNPVRNFQDIRAIMRGVNDKIGALKAQGGEGFGEMMQLKRSFAEALERSANAQAGPAYEALQAANTAYRQEIAVDALTDIVKKNLNPLEGRDTWNFSAGKTLKALNEAVRKDKFLADSFPEGSLAAIRNRLETLRTLPLPGAPPGAEAGSKVMMRRGIVGGATAEIANYVLGGHLPTAVAGGIGALTSLGVAQVVSEALLTQRGTQLLLKTMQPGAGLARPTLAAIAGATRAELSASWNDLPPIPGISPPTIFPRELKMSETGGM